MVFLRSMIEYINTNYGTYRGLIRLILAWLELLLGRLTVYQNIDMSKVNRIVFVCLGNVCRSPYAELIAREQGLPSASFGLSTTNGLPAFVDAEVAARARNRDLSVHKATDFSSFEVQDTDLLLVMEVRQIGQLKSLLKTTNAQISLLGLWADPPRPHIHDPMKLSPEYFIMCYRVIESAVINLEKRYLLARPK